MPLDHLPGTFFGPNTLVELVRHRAEHQPDDIAFTFLVDGEEEQIHITNLELDRQARAIGSWLESLGLVGERALLLYPAGLEFISAFFGCVYAGVTAVPVYPPRRNRSLERIQAIADDAEAKVALTTDSVLRRVEPLIDDTPHLKQLTWLATCHCPAGLDQSWRMPDIHTDTLAFLQYTSGSTGTPKGVMLTHANLIHNSALIAYAFEHTRSGLGVFWLPSYHDMGLIGGILQPLYCGRPNILMSPMAFLQRPVRWLSAISRFGGTTSGGPNFAYDLCVRSITPEQRERLDLSTWTVAFNGAEPVHAETIERFCEVFEPCGFRRDAFYPCFGLAEATLIVSGGYVEQSPMIRTFDAAALADNRAIETQRNGPRTRSLVGCGATLRDQEIVIADPETRSRLEEGRIGEIWVRGPSVAQGYWRRPQATKETFEAHLAHAGDGGFLRTGDLGFLREGELFVTGRIKDLFIFRGVNIYPHDIERTVERGHPRLRPESGAAFTVEVDGQERLVVVHELQRRKKGDFEEVFSAVRRAVSVEHELALDAIVFVKAGSIPKTSSGKIQRHACRQGFLEGTLAVITQWGAQPLQRQTSLYEQSEGSAKEAAGQGPTEAKVSNQPRSETTVLAESGADGSQSSDGRVAGNGRAIARQVLEEVTRVAKDQARGLTLDTNIVEIGLDSMERIQIVAALEERFGGRFPEDVLPGLETCRQVVEAVQNYLGKVPSQEAARVAVFQPSEETYQIAKFPEYVRLRQNLELVKATGMGSPLFCDHRGSAAGEKTGGGPSMIDFSTYNYLGLAGSPTVIRAAQEAAGKYGTSVSASRRLSDERPLFRELEQAIAGLVETEDAVILDGSRAAAQTVIGHLFGSSDLILYDSLAHKSIVQGSILSGARHVPFDHNDWRSLDRLLDESRYRHRRVLIAIEGVSSMEGDVAKLPKFIDRKKRHKALLLVDEAHSIGTLGAHGQGIGEHFDVSREDVDIWIGTLSNALGGTGGYVAGTGALIDYLRYTAPGYALSAGLSPPGAAAALASIQLLKKGPQRVARLQDRSRQFLALAKDRGLNTGTSKESPMVPIILGNSMVCLQLSKAMISRGVYVEPTLYPAVDEQDARLRFFLTALHSEEQIEFTLDTLVEELDRVHREFTLQPGRQTATSARTS